MRRRSDNSGRAFQALRMPRRDWHAARQEVPEAAPKRRIVESAAWHLEHQHLGARAGWCPGAGPAERPQGAVRRARVPRHGEGEGPAGSCDHDPDLWGVPAHVDRVEDRHRPEHRSVLRRADPQLLGAVPRAPVSGRAAGRTRGGDAGRGTRLGRDPAAGPGLPTECAERRDAAGSDPREPGRTGEAPGRQAAPGAGVDHGAG
jgi:hypothetical protein